MREEGKRLTAKSHSVSVMPGMQTRLRWDVFGSSSGVGAGRARAWMWLARRRERTEMAASGGLVMCIVR